MSDGCWNINIVGRPVYGITLDWGRFIRLSVFDGLLLLAATCV